MTSEEEECSASETRDSLPPGITSAPTSMLYLEDDCGAGTQHCPTANRPAMGEDPPKAGVIIICDPGQVLALPKSVFLPDPGPQWPQDL